MPSWPVADLYAAVEELSTPILVMHAAGDEQVPVEHSRELSLHFRSPRSRLIVVPGGHHRSVQHDPELQAVSVKFLVKAFSSRDERAPSGSAHGLDAKP